MKRKLATQQQLLKISSVSVNYGSGKTQGPLALDNVSLDVPMGGYTIGLVGESGSGKTTLGMSLLNIIEPPGHITSGSVEYAGSNVLAMSKQELRKYRWREVSMVYQSAMNSLNPVKRISDPIMEVLIQHLRISKSEAYRRAVGLLSDVGIKENRVDDYPHELSGGMRQRVVIALALALSPKMLIADEPTSALDVVVQKQIISLLKSQVKQRNLSLLFITHEIALLSGLVDHVAVMYQGEVVEIGPHDKVLFQPLHPYTETLLSTLLTMESSAENLSSSSSRSSQKRGLQLGLENACKYASRCKYAFERCKNERPKLLEVEKGRWVSCHKFN